MKTIPLTQGKFAIVDDADAYLCKWNWSVSTWRGLSYAMRTEKTSKGWVPMRLHHAIIGQPIRKDFVVDHINGNGLDCRRDNLRIITNRENICFQSRRRSGKTTSQFPGVHKCGDRIDRWRVRICVKNKKIYIGDFHSEVEAAVAYQNAVKQFST